MRFSSQIGERIVLLAMPPFLPLENQNQEAETLEVLNPVFAATFSVQNKAKESVSSAQPSFSGRQFFLVPYRLTYDVI